MRLATWNINGIKARLPYLLHWLDEVKPDVVGLQEIKTVAEKFPAQEIEERGYKLRIFGQKAWNGVAVLSRTEAEVVTEGLPGQGEQGARLLSVQTGSLRFTTVYVPNGKSLEHPDFEGKLGWLDALGRFTLGVGEGPHLLCGDFNVCPEPIDSWSEERLAGEIFHTPDERARISGLKATGLVDLWREKRPEEPGFSWWDYRQGAFHKRQGLRIDLLLGTKEIVSKTRDVQTDRKWRKKIDGLISSDHLPIWADVEL